mmetsp:Transcript_10465/g.23743  ORF Transcript_10465/g.23743 Transcript_10465/m.23743 type:complete len:501 (+) Transcript_10465:91-1593(+)
MTKKACVWCCVFSGFIARAIGGRMSEASLVFTQENGTSEVLQIEGSENECFVAHLNFVCYCEKKKYRTGRYQCTGCKNAFKWGYGCELDCPLQCKMGCDFAGNCLRHAACKHSKRVPGDKDVFVNSRGECQSCIHDGENYRWGENCEHECPLNCKVSEAEGACTRNGACYSCKDGWFGAQCDRACPDACPKCVQKENSVPSLVRDTYLPAGACARICLNGKWGAQCENDCPNHCMRQGGQTCSTGICDFGCDGHQFYGERCETHCSPGCKKKQCSQSDGACMKDGCNDGYWGPKCEQRCPDHSLGGCRQTDGRPNGCEEGYYPHVQKKQGQKVQTCKLCSPNCKTKECNAKGSCTSGCKEGAFGEYCTDYCPASCDGPCDTRETGLLGGTCRACLAGSTGARCDAQCHATCQACKQYTGSSGGSHTLDSPEGDNAFDCTACRLDEPVQLNAETGTCDCIRGAARKGESAHCECEAPAEDPAKQAVFNKSSRRCIVRATVH